MPITPGSNNELEVEITGDGSDLSSTVAAAKSNIGGLMQKVGALSAALGALGVAGFGAAVNEARQFEQAMVEVEKVTDPQTAREMAGAIKQMSTEIPIAQKELADLTAQAGRFGIRGTKNIEKFVRTTAKMATATDLNATEAGEAFARLSTLMDLPVQEADRLGAAINELSNTAATSSQEIVDAMLRGAGVMDQMGLQSQEIVALSGALNEVSESSRRAGSRLRRLGQELMDPGKVGDLASAFNMTEVEFKQMRKEAPLQTIKRMAQLMADGGKQADLLRSTLSTTSRQALAGLSQNLDGLNQALKTTGGQFENATSLQKEFDAATNTFNAQLTMVRNRLRNVAITLGTALLPALTAFLKRLKPMLARLEEFVSGLSETQIQVAAVGSAVLGILGALSMLGVSLGSILGPLTAVGGALVGLPGLLAGVGTAAAGATATLYGTIYGALGAVGGALSSLSGLLLALPGAVATAASSLAVTLTTAATTAYTALVGLPGTVLALSGALKVQLVSAASSAAMALLTLPARAAAAAAAFISSASMTGIFSAALGGLQTVATLAAGGVQVLTASLLTLAAPVGAAAIAVAALYGAWKTNFLGMRDITQGVVTFLKALLRGDIGTMKSIVLNGVRSIRGYWEQHIQPMAATARRVFTRIKTVIKQVLTFVWANVIQPIVARIRKVWAQHGAALRREAAETWQAIRGYIQTVVNFLRPLITRFTNATSTAWSMWGDEIEAIARVTFDAILGIIEFAADAILTSLRVMANIVQGDWEAAWNAIEDFLKRTFHGIAGWLSSTGKNIVKAAIGAITGAVKDAFKALGNWLIGNSFIPELIGDVASWLRGAGTRLVKSAFGTVIGGAQSAIESIDLSPVKRSVQGVVNKANNAISALRDIPSNVSTTVTRRVNTVTNTVGGAISGAVPGLDTGGFIEDAGLAMLHAGEQVVPAADVDRGRSDSGGGGTTINIGRIEANGRREGREAAKALRSELRSGNF